MKKIIVFILLLFVKNAYSYNFPIEDKYSATIIGSSTLMIEGVSEEVPTKVYEIKIKEKVPEIFWYAENFKFTLTPQKEEAPLIFLLAGTGSDYSSIRMKNFERILYDAGYSIISISSPMSAQFLISASKNSVPGLLMIDNKDIYDVMKLAYEKIKNKVKVSDFYIMGYSLGATNSAVISYIDEKEKYFNFKKVYMVNPAVDLYESARKLDNFLDEYTKGNIFEVEELIKNTINRMKKNMKNEYTTMNEETIFSIVKGDFLSEAEKKAFIGLAFRINSVDLNFISDVFSKSYVYTRKDEKLTKYSNLFENFKRVQFSNFKAYIDRIGYPFYKKMNENFSMEELRKQSNLRIIDEYIRKSNKIVAVTNEDEIILSKEDLEYLRDVFGNRIKIYPKGGHCGNMFYRENVDTMLFFLKNGVLKYEE